MNPAALKLADEALLGHPIITLKKGKNLYHGARTRKPMKNIKPNAMFTSSLHYAVGYAFIRDQNRNQPDLYRSLFCCTLEKDIDILLIKDIDWPDLCMKIKKSDDSMPLYDGWLQQHLTHYINMRYGSRVDGAQLLSSSNDSLDEFIFKDATSILSIRHIID